jgi:hypothetical protein
MLHPHTLTLEGLKALLLVESPIAFRRRLIFTEAEPLRHARMSIGPPLGSARPAALTCWLPRLHR